MDNSAAQKTSIRCTLPWTDLKFTVLGGEAKVCCWTKTTLGKLDDFPSLDAVWNGEAIRSFRRNMAEGALEKICPPTCPRLLDGSTRLDRFQAPEGQPDHPRSVIKRVMWDGGDMVPVPPLNINVPVEDKCSLRCVMCSKNTGTFRIHPNFYSILHDASRSLELLTITGGEPFFSTEVIRILREAVKRPPGYKFSFVTSLSHFPAPLLQKLRIRWICVSVDGGTRKTYEAIRRGASWENLMLNFRRLLTLRDSAAERFDVAVNFTLMAGNFRDIPAAVRLFNGLGVPIEFNQVRLPRGHPQNFRETTDLREEVLGAVREGIKAGAFEATTASLGRILMILEQDETNRTLDRAAILAGRGEYGEARELIEKTITRDPRNPRARALLGHICKDLWAQGRKEEAVGIFQGITREPTRADATCG